jgi:TPR repeat protein
MLLGQERKGSQVFKKNEPTKIPLVLPSTLDYQLLEAFVLMQKANAGEAPAQHELGLRYLLGRGFLIDTLRAALWIQKAAEQKLPLAQYNLGILFMHGYGVEWNPFEAFKQFHSAANEEMPDALFVLGLMYSENLVVQRNWPKVYQYIKQSAEFGFEPAKESKKELERRGLDKAITDDIVAPGVNRPKNDTPRTARSDTAFSLVFIDFHADTTTTVEDTTLIREAYQDLHSFSNNETASSTLVTKLDSAAQSILTNAATVGNPEALCVLGRCFEQGLGVQKDLILAGVYYLRALRLDSYRAPALLWKMMNTEEFAHQLETRSAQGNPNALYVWSGLTAVGFSKLLNDKQAFDLLLRAASAEHVPAMVEIGSCYFTGRWTQQDKNSAIEWWNRASKLGSLEADIRLATANILGQIRTQDLNTSLTILRNASQEGSLLSDLTLAYCYERGIGMQQNKGEAYRIYHKTMRRGSESAYRALRRMHDELRPAEDEFQMPD